MKKYLQMMAGDIRSGRNIDVYLTELVCAGLLILDVFGIVSVSAVSSGILAVLMLIALGTLGSRHTNEAIRNTLTNIAASQETISADRRE